MRAEETARFIEYDWVMRVRSDMHFTRRMPTVYEIFASQSRGRDLLLRDDLIAIARRRDAHAVFRAPAEAASHCISREVWREACVSRGPSTPEQLKGWDRPYLDAFKAPHKLPCPPCFPCTVMALATHFADQPRDRPLTWQPLWLGAAESASPEGAVSSDAVAEPWAAKPMELSLGCVAHIERPREFGNASHGASRFSRHKLRDENKAQARLNCTPA